MTMPQEVHGGDVTVPADTWNWLVRNMKALLAMRTGKGLNLRKGPAWSLALTQAPAGTTPIRVTFDAVAGTATVTCDFWYEYEYAQGAQSRLHEDTVMVFNAPVASYYTIVLGYNVAARLDTALYWYDGATGAAAPDPADATTIGLEREAAVVSFPVAYITVEGATATVWDVGWAPVELDMTVHAYQPPAPQLKVDEAGLMVYWDHGGHASYVAAVAVPDDATTNIYAGRESDGGILTLRTDREVLLWATLLGTVTMASGKCTALVDYSRGIQYREKLPQVRVKDSTRTVYWDHGGAVGTLSVVVPDNATTDVYVGETAWTGGTPSLSTNAGDFVWSHLLARVRFTAGVSQIILDLSPYHHLTPVGDTTSVQVLTGYNVSVDGSGHVTSQTPTYTTLYFDRGVKYTP